MKPLLILFFSFGSFFSIAQKQDSLRHIENKAFTVGERLKFRVHYGFVSAGYANIDVYPEVCVKGGRVAYRCVGIGESVGAFDWFFKVRDRYETYIDKESIAPLIFIRRVDEGGYKISQDYVFNHKEGNVFNGKSFKSVTPYVQDMLSSFYFTRCNDFSKSITGDIFSVPTYVDDSLYITKMKFIRRETISTEIGTFKCMLFRPVIQTGRIFKKEEDLNVWISDDENKIPIRAQANLLVGSIKLDLVEYSGLLNPLVKVEK